MPLLVSIALATTFTELPSGGPHDGDGTLGTGIGIADMNGDGSLDLVVLGRDNSSGTGGRLLLQDPAVPFAFTDVTATLAPGFSNGRFDRMAVLADFDHDGRRDVALYSNTHFAYWRQLPQDQGGMFAEDPDYTAADPTWHPTHPNPISGFNFEGTSVTDIDRDQWLELLAGWRFSALDGLEDPASASLSSGHAGLPADNAVDDWSSMEDIDGDGWLDLVVARAGTDILMGGPTGFTPDPTLEFYEQPYKGAPLLCDFDDDGDLDLIRVISSEGSGSAMPPVTPDDSNTIWLYQQGTWVDAGNPGIDSSRDVLAAECGDVDNDGDLDLVIGYRDGDMDVLRQGAAGWISDPGGIDSNATAVKGLAVADIDGDGALDVYVQESNFNELWANDLVGDAHLSVSLMANVGTCEAPLLRDDFHAAVRVGSPSGSTWTGIRPLYGPHGAGISGTNPVHVGLGSLDPTALLQLEIRPYTVRSDGTVESVTTVEVRPTDLPGQHLQVRTDDPDGDGIPNAIEGIRDSDGDGTPDRAELDSDDDGIPDAIEAIDPCAPSDFDGDGLFDFQDSDSDDDGVPDATDCARLDPEIGIVVSYQDADGDGFGGVNTVVGCEIPSGYVAAPGDCADDDPDVNPGVDERCDTTDHDCDGDPLLDAVDTIDLWLDLDGDGYGDPAAQRSECTSLPGYVENADDCDDTQPLAWIGNAEVCDGVDNDCDGGVDIDPTDGNTWYVDQDGDQFGTTPVTGCTQPSNTASADGDCDDTDSAVFPGAPEQCNDADDDCDGLADENTADLTFYEDADGDGYGIASSVVVACALPSGYAVLSGDCDDGDANVNPGEVDFCNQIDDNCSGDETDAVDQGTFYVDADGDGWGDLDQPAFQACGTPPDASVNLGDCDDSDPNVSPDQAEICDGIDNDCNFLPDDNAAGQVVAYLDQDGDGYGNPASQVVVCPSQLPSGFVDNADDCNDANPQAWTGNVEICDGADNDCDSLVDADDPDLPPGSTEQWFLDEDGDGYGAGAAVEACTPPLGHVDNADDCDDADSAVFPTATDIPDNGIDEDCDGADATVEPPLADSDGDGIPDQDELPGDFDGDGLDDVDDPDSDNDGVIDGLEQPEFVRDNGELEVLTPPPLVKGCAISPVSTGSLGLFLACALLRRRR